MSNVDSDLNKKGAEILSDDLLNGIAAGFDGESAEFLADGLIDQLTGENGSFTFEAGYTKEQVKAAFSLGLRGLRTKETPAA